MIGKKLHAPPRLSHARRRRCLLTLSLCAGLTHCGGTTEQAESPAAPGEPETTATDSDECATCQNEDGEELSAAERDALQAIEQEEAASEAERESGTEAEEPPEYDQREIVYHVTSQGLRIEVDSAKFHPTAEAVRRSGGWGVELHVKAEAEEPRVLLASQSGPLALGGRVTRKSGKVEQFGDRRDAENEISFGPDSPAEFSQTWPDELAPLAPGDALELHVGLWGLGPTPETRRPLRRFVLVKMRAGPSGAQPVIQPPPQ